jgi:hypothetical protein
MPLGPAAGMVAGDLGQPDVDGHTERLYLSVRTVNNHLQHVYTKLGVSSRADLARALEGFS